MSNLSENQTIMPKQRKANKVSVTNILVLGIYKIFLENAYLSSVERQKIG